MKPNKWFQRYGTKSARHKKGFYTGEDEMLGIHILEVNKTSHLLQKFIKKFENTKQHSYVEGLIQELNELELEYEEMMRVEYRQEIMDWWKDWKILWRTRQIIIEYSSKAEKELKKRN